MNIVTCRLYSNTVVFSRGEHTEFQQWIGWGGSIDKIKHKASCFIQPQILRQFDILIYLWDLLALTYMKKDQKEQSNCSFTIDVEGLFCIQFFFLIFSYQILIKEYLTDYKLHVEFSGLRDRSGFLVKIPDHAFQLVLSTCYRF